MKPNQIDPFTIYGGGTKKASIKEMCHGKSWLRDSNMTDVIEGKFLRNSIEERILRREDSGQRSRSNFLKANMDHLKIKRALQDIKNMSRYGYASKTPQLTSKVFNSTQSRLQMENQNVYTNKISK